MEQPSTSRPKLTPRKFNNVSNKNPFTRDNNNEHFSSNRGLKRKNSDEISVGGKKHFTTTHTDCNSSSAGANKFSANARLMRYRKTLEKKQNEVVKVHTLQKATEKGAVQENQGHCKTETDVNQRLNVSERETQKSSTLVNNVNQRLKAAKTVCSPCVSVNQRVNTAAKEDCGQKPHAFPLARTNSLPSSAKTEANFLNSRLKKYKDSALTSEEKPHSSALESEDVEMDWSPIAEEQLITDINNLRQNVSEILNHKSSFEEMISSEIPKNDFVFKDTFIVIDTNIFISHLNLVQYLLDINLHGVDKPFILIPWVVIQELDYMKDGRDGRKVLQKSAKTAVDFINKNLLRKDTTLKGQSVIDATKHSIPCNNLDDGIVACCLQVNERGNRAILLSNDKNLRNKSLVNAIPAHSSKDIFQHLGLTSPTKQSSTMQNLPKSDDVRRQLTTLFNTIIHSEALSIYGEFYNAMGVFKDAPWSLEQCLLKFEKLWITIFSGRMPKQFLQNVEELRKFLNSRKCIRTEDEFERLVKLGLNICLFLKNGLNEYYQLTIECIDKIVKLT